ncbi:MAG: tRNA adenosine(34) deaminase TadA [bacterium]
MHGDDLLASFRSHDRWMLEAIREAEQAAEKGEVPVGAVVVYQDRLLGRGHNQVETLRDATAHAEILAIGAAATTLGDWRLDGASLYVTLEPCIMCSGAMLLSRLGKLVYGASDKRAGAVVSTSRLFDGNPYRQSVEIVGGILAERCTGILQDFFRRRREPEPPGNC